MGKDTKTKIYSIVLLFIMVLSVVGFAVISSVNPNSSNNYNSNNQDLPFGNYWEDSNNNLLYGAVKNKEQFIFFNYNSTTYDSRIDFLNFSNKVLETKSINLINLDINQKDSEYKIIQALNALKIEFTRLSELTNLSTLKNTIIISNQTNIDTDKSNVNIDNFNTSEILVYYLVRN